MSTFLTVLIIIFFVILSSFLPIGNADSTVRRLPWVTFLIIAANVLIYYGTLPRLAEDQKAFVGSGLKLERLLMESPEMLADATVREKLVEAGIISKAQEEQIETQMKLYESMAGGFGSAPSADAIKKLETILEEFQEAKEASLWYSYGFAPNGQWKPHQLITSAFFHADFMHLFGNMICFFAIAFTLEDLWGRGVFLGFYLLGAAASCFPSVVSPEPLVGIGASGAIFATMGAFLVRLPKTKIKLFILPMWTIRFLLGAKKFTVMIPGYVYLIATFAAQLISFYYVKKSGGISTVGYTVHIAGFVFGAGFAAFMKASKIEQTYIHPKIEAKVSFSAAPEITEALELLDKGDSARAERVLRQHMSKQPENPETMLALIQVYQRTENYDQLNSVYGRLIRYHLGKQDKEAALFAYDTLLQAFPDDNVAARIPARDWIVLCEYLREADMNREASVEFERLVNAWPDDPISVRAALLGAETAFMATDVKRALNLFEKAQAMNPPQVLVSRIENGLEKCRRILDNRPGWVKKPPKAPTIYRGF
jgi:membrane associated rhomboid family serine protease/outer membrane protein assembly factor BamD (BamD/ComL family)